MPEYTMLDVYIIIGVSVIMMFALSMFGAWAYHRALRNRLDARLGAAEIPELSELDLYIRQQAAAFDRDNPYAGRRDIHSEYGENADWWKN